jgi:hypothetical protein
MFFFFLFNPIPPPTIAIYQILLADHSCSFDAKGRRPENIPYFKDLYFEYLVFMLTLERVCAPLRIQLYKIHPSKNILILPRL